MSIVEVSAPSVSPTMSSLKLTVVSDYDYPGGGVEHFVRELLGHARESCECRLVTWTAGCLQPAGFEGLELLQHGDVRQAWAAMEWADLVVVVTSFNVRLLAHLAGEFARVTAKPQITVVQTSGHSDPATAAAQTQERWLVNLLSASRAVVAVSDPVAAALASLLERVPGAPPVEVIENAARLVPKQEIRRGRSRVSFMGRPFPQKGFDLFLRLAADLQGRGLEFHANTVSVPLDDPPPHVRFSSLLSDSQLVEFFAGTDLLVVPYRRADGLPMAVLEALNCGVPVLGLDSPAVSELLRRHHQPVIPHSYDAMRDAVLNWQAGRLEVVGSVPGQVVGWARQVERYLQLARSVVAAQHV